MTTAQVRLPALDWKVAIVDPATGLPSPYLQRFWQNITVKVSVAEGGVVDVSGKVDKGTSAGWSAPTGTSSRATFATYAAPTISASPTQAEVQAIANALQDASRRLAAYIQAGITSGLLAP